MYRIYMLIAAAFWVLVGCQETDEFTAHGQVALSLSRSYSNDLTQGAQAGDAIRSLRYYICDGGKVTVVSDDFGGAHAVIKLEKVDVTPTAKIYVIANGELSEQVDALAVGSGEAVFSTLETLLGQTNGQFDALAMSASVPLGAYLQGGTVPIKLRRNMARFDLSVQENVGIEVIGITVSGLPTAGSVFEGGSVQSENKAIYTSHFTTPQTAPITGLFYSYERPVGGSAAVAEIDVKYNGRLTTLIAPMGDIRRNSIYRLAVAANLGSVSATVDVSGMEEGDSDHPQNTDKVFDIHQVSSASQGVSVSGDKKRLNLPYFGVTAEMILGTKEMGVELKSVEGAVDNFTITRTSSSTAPTYEITTSANARIGAAKKVVILNFTLPSDQTGNVHQLMVSIDNYAPFPIVTIGALDWMHYNASNVDIIDYPVLSNNTDVRSMYREPAMWQLFTGKIYQWGPRPGRNGAQVVLSSWGSEYLGHDVMPNVNGAIIGNPSRWEGETVPCPEGWRLATYDDYQSIWPPNGTKLEDNVPVAYTTSKGNACTAVIETFGGTYRTNITESGNRDGSNEKAKNLIISDGTVEILFPIAGYRKKNGTFKPTNPGNSLWNTYGLGLGEEGYYWCADKANSNKNFVAVGIYRGVIQNHTNNREHNTWFHQRCVRSKK